MKRLPASQRCRKRAPRSPGVRASVVVRSARVAGFPYSVAFVELENELRVIAIAHDKRKPGYWLKRLDR
jgi:hypothetical protein